MLDARLTELIAAFSGSVRGYKNSNAVASRPSRLKLGSHYISLLLSHGEADVNKTESGMVQQQRIAVRKNQSRRLNESGCVGGRRGQHRLSIVRRALEARFPVHSNMLADVSLRGSNVYCCLAFLIALTFTTQSLASPSLPLVTVEKMKIDIQSLTRTEKWKSIDKFLLLEFFKNKQRDWYWFEGRWDDLPCSVNT